MPGRQTVFASLLVLVSFIAAPAKASLSSGQIDDPAVPDWIAVTAAPISYDFHPELPPQIEQVLMLRLDEDADNVIDATVAALLRDARAADSGASEVVLSNVRAGLFVAGIWLVLFLGAHSARRRWQRNRVPHPARPDLG